MKASVGKDPGITPEPSDKKIEVDGITDPFRQEIAIIPTGKKRK